MRPLEATFRDLRQLHVWMGLGALALLGATVWMIAAEYRQPWRQYQREYRRLLASAPEAAPPRRRPAIEQIWLPDLTLDYHFQRVARFDRCTTCHQGIGEVDRGFPQPFRSHPRPEFLAGSDSPHPVEEFGCTICHDGQGSGTSFRHSSHSPDTPEAAARWRREHDWQPNPHWEWPMLPLRFVESRCLQCHHEVTDLEPSERFPDPPAPKLMAGYHLIREHGCFGCHEIDGYDAAGRRIGPDMRLEPENGPPGDGRPPGTMRKVGPSLRDIAQKLTPAMVIDRTADPHRFLPDTRMPRLYGLHEHLSGAAREEAERFEAVELHAIAAYLFASAETIEPLPSPEGFVERPELARGRKIFQLQGCLACHTHETFPEAHSAVGPDLSRLGAKYTTESGRAWLADFLRDPMHRSPRTLMPHVPLEPVAGGPSRFSRQDGPQPQSPPRDAANVEGFPSPAQRDEPGDDAPPPPPNPVGDVVAFLLHVPPYPTTEPDYQSADLDELVLMHLARTMPREEAERLLRNSPASGFPGLGEPSPFGAHGATPSPLATRHAAVQPSPWKTLPASPTTQEKLRYVGQRTIAKRGCYACHGIPGFEDAPPIGPALTDWGRKRESLLAFEQVDRYLAEAAARGDATPDPFYLNAVRQRRREGFLWQKLREPRSFDYRLADDRPLSEWLTMGQFDFTAEEREAVMTFVLGLTAEPPTEKYVYEPDRKRRAIVEGRQVLDRFACAECHTLRMEQWTIAYDPGRFEPPPAHEDFDWLLPEFSQAEIEASLEVDDRGLARAVLTGMPQLDSDGRLAIVDEEEDPEGNDILLYAFILWEPAVLAGETAAVGGADVLVWSDQIAQKRPAWGGDLARLLYPAALAEARAAGAHPIGPEAWGWLPPPLGHTGKALRPEWLHEYLLRPYPVRPASMMRMPQYTLSPDEAGKLADFFAATAEAEFPYTATPSRRLRDEPLTPERQERFGGAMRMLLDEQAYCARCHQIGDYRPGDAVPTTLAPDLTQVSPRLRVAFLRRWLASPTSVLPYTPMPANFPPSGQSLDPIGFPGDSVEQLESMTELLLNFDWYLRRRRSVRELMEATLEERPRPTR